MLWNKEANQNSTEELIPQVGLTSLESKSLSNIRAEPGDVIDINHLKEKYTDKHLGRRCAPRYSIHFEVVLMSSKKSFRSKTINISESGALLTELVPTELTREIFEVLFTAIDNAGKKEYFLFHAKAADGPLRSKRIQFTRSMGDSATRLNHLIEQFTPIEV